MSLALETNWQSKYKEGEWVSERVWKVTNYTMLILQIETQLRKYKKTWESLYLEGKEGVQLTNNDLTLRTGNFCERFRKLN